MTKKKAPEDRKKMGRPAAFETPEQLAELCEAYCERIQTEEDFIPTINGLALALGVDQTTLLDYRKKPDFSQGLKKVMASMRGWWEKRLAGNACTGAIFWLKNMADWADKTQSEVTATVKYEQLTDDQVNARLAELMADRNLMQSITTKPTEH